MGSNRRQNNLVNKSMDEEIGDLIPMEALAVPRGREARPLNVHPWHHTLPFVENQLRRRESVHHHQALMEPLLVRLNNSTPSLRT